MKLRNAVLLGAAVACLLGGCTSVVDGSGKVAVSEHGPTSVPTPSTPGTPGAVPSNGSGQALATGCPTVRYPSAHITYRCLTDGMQTLNNSDPVWPVQQYKTVETASKWAISEGARGPLAAPQSALAALAAEARGYSVAENDYLTSPTVKTVSGRATVINGAKAYVLESAITLNTAAAEKINTNVKVEYRWDVAIETGSSQATVWFVSVPDISRSLWPSVPALINSITVT